MSTKIEILGTGCAKCQTTAQVVEEAVQELNLDATITKVEDMVKIMEYDVLSTPAVVVDGMVKIKGRVPTKADIKELLQDL